MYMYIYICMPYTSVCVYIQRMMHMCIYIYSINIFTYKYVHTYINIHVRMYTHADFCRFTRNCKKNWTSSQAPTSKNMHTLILSQTHTRTHTHTYTLTHTQDVIYNNIMRYTARSREDETRNARRNANRNPWWSKFILLFKRTVQKETLDDHQGFRFAFRWPFRVLSSRQDFESYLLGKTSSLIFSITGCAARSVEDESRNGHRNAKRNPNRNQETTILRLFSNFETKRDLEQ